MSNTLTSRERLRRCFFGEEVDRPGVYCRTGIPRGDSTYDPLRRLLAERTDLKRDWGARTLIPERPVYTTVEPYSEDFERHVHRMPTPAGDLLSTRLIGLHGQPGMITKHWLSDERDIERYLSLPVPEIGDDVDGFFRRDREVGDRGVAVANLGSNPGGEVGELFGSEALAILSVTHREAIHAVCRREMELLLRVVDLLIARGVGPFFCMLGQEYICPPLHGPRDFDDFNVRYDAPIIERVHAAGGRMHVHCHGPVGKVLDGFLAAGVDVLHPIEPPPMGDLTAVEAKRRLRGRMCIEGNIQIADMYDAPPEAVRVQTRQLIADAFDDRRGLIVCPTASPYIPRAGWQCIEQFRAMVEEVGA